MFDADGLSVQPIREDQQYGGVRVTTVAFLGKPGSLYRLMSVSVTPLRRTRRNWSFLPLLTTKGPLLKAYPKETVVAEKLQEIVTLGRANSQMKDFYDLLALSRHLDFDGRTLASASRATFERRGTRYFHGDTRRFRSQLCAGPGEAAPMGGFCPA